LQDFAYKISIFPDDTPTLLPLPQREGRYLDPDTNFCFARQRSRCSCFTKRQLVTITKCSWCLLFRQGRKFTDVSLYFCTTVLYYEI